MNTLNRYRIFQSLRARWAGMLALLPAFCMYATAQDIPALRELPRSVPAVRLTTVPVFQQWTNDGAAIHEFSIPLAVQLLLRPDLSFTAAISQASASGDDLEPVSGLTDARISLDYVAGFGLTRLVVSVGAHLPTGANRLSEPAYDTAFLLGLNQYNFRVPFFGQGASLTPGVTLVTAITGRTVLSVGGSYRFRGRYEPVRDLAGAYDWGNEIILAAGGEHQATSAISISADIALTIYAPDEIDGAAVYDAGSRTTARLQLHGRLPAGRLTVEAYRRSVQTNQALTGGALRPEVLRAAPNLWRFTARFDTRLSKTIALGLQAERAAYERDFAFEDLDIWTLGLEPRVSVSPAASFPLVFKYHFGELQGVEIGLGFSAIF